MRNQRAYKTKYLLSNLGKGLIWLTIIVGMFIVIKRFYGDAYDNFMDAISDQPILVFLVFTLSEVLFGIIPPELFMIWATKLKAGSTGSYYLIVLALAVLSYLCGTVGYYFGLRFSKTNLYLRLSDKFASQFEKNVKRFGGYMIAVAALTPIPYSAVCMLTGSARFKFSYFLLLGIFRLARFLFYGFIMWQVGKI